MNDTNATSNDPNAPPVPLSRGALAGDGGRGIAAKGGSTLEGCGSRQRDGAGNDLGAGMCGENL